jgi:hypothetical protein
MSPFHVKTGSSGSISINKWLTFRNNMILWLCNAMENHFG